MRSRRLLLAFVAIASREAGAQTRVLLQAAHRDTLTADPGGTVTAIFEVRNDTDHPVRAEPRVIVPKGWSVVIGATPFDVAERGRDAWLIGIAPAPTATAGAYVIRTDVNVDGIAVLSDSIVVRVTERHSLDIYPANAPLFVLAGDDYAASFYVHNRGNTEATIRLRPLTSDGAGYSLERHSVTVAPGATVLVAGHVISRRVQPNTRDNVVELLASDQADSTSTASASLRTTIVPRSRRWLDELFTVPAELSLRTVGRNAGVSPASLSGGGPLVPGGDAQLDFLFRAPVEGPAIFGERDEYRVSLTADRYRVRLGDNLYGFSQLSSSWLSGFGAEVRGEVSGVTAGAYVKQNRWTRIPGSERALLLGTSSDRPLSLSFVGVDRTGSVGPSARMGAVGGQARLGGGSSILEFETAFSDSAGMNGEAHRARLSGDFANVNYDVGMIRGTNTFSGRDHGQTNLHAGFSTRLTDWMTLTGNGGSTLFIPTFRSAGFSRMRSGILEAGLLQDRLTIGYEQITRSDSIALMELGGSERGLRMRSSLPLPVRSFTLFADVAAGMARDIAPQSHGYQSVALTLRTPLVGSGWIDFFTRRTSGMVFQTSGISGGATANVPLPHATRLLLSAYGDHPVGLLRTWTAQLDAEVSHTLQSGATLIVRDRMSNYGWNTTGSKSHLIFLEVRAPLRVPTGLARTVARARGTIVDEETGLGVSGALVRLGDEAAVSDANGRVSFASLKPGRYHASVDGIGASRAPDAMLTGDVAVDVTAGERRPPAFSLALTRGGRLRVDVRQLDFTTTLAGTGADSLVDAGGFGGGMIALIGARDTIYQSTNQKGVADFVDLPAGRWSVKLIADVLPEAHAVESDELAVVIRPGERAALAFRIVPKRRAVQFVEPRPPVIVRPLPNPLPTHD